MHTYSVVRLICVIVKGDSTYQQRQCVKSACMTVTYSTHSPSVISNPGRFPWLTSAPPGNYCLVLFVTSVRSGNAQFRKLFHAGRISDLRRKQERNKTPPRRMTNGVRVSAPAPVPVREPDHRQRQFRFKNDEPFFTSAEMHSNRFEFRLMSSLLAPLMLC